ncbi:hypothetical protein NWFMUON74_30710 [Nocardia wallacei]|uniref:Uncharacterized protein n=1 Tax=Nocardia wallacei TaxID=480035 RepID=A0A7G1KN29_9NOCA|nr:hypothetical protein NWFMUON74_30710 [Nocardia wallacei]
MPRQVSPISTIEASVLFAAAFNCAAMAEYDFAAASIDAVPGPVSNGRIIASAATTNGST